MKMVLLLVSVMMLIACNANFEAPIENAKTASECSLKISEDEAVRRLEKLLTLIEPTMRGGNRTIKEVIPHLTPKTRTATSSELPDTLMYIINFDDEDGYAVVSADERASDFILALIDTGNYIPTRVEESYLDAFSFEDLYNLLEEDEKDDFWCAVRNPTTITFPTIEMIEDFLLSEMDNNVEYKIVREDTVLMNQVGPFLRTKWGQGYPYNCMCHFSLEGHFHYDPTVINCKTGCIATALAQILAYHKYPSSAYGHTFDWASMLGKEEDNDSIDKRNREVARLMKSAGLACQMNYGIEASSSTAKKAKKALKNTFGYSGAERSLGFYATRIVDKLNSGAMALVTGKKRGRFSGHAWVIDGYRKYKFTTTIITYTDDTYTEIKSSEVVDEEEKYYYHCNYGWGGTANGYYLGKIFNAYHGPEFVDDVDPYMGDAEEHNNYTWLFRTVTYNNPNR